MLEFQGTAVREGLQGAEEQQGGIHWGIAHQTFSAFWPQELRPWSPPLPQEPQLGKQAKETIGKTSISHISPLFKSLSHAISGFSQSTMTRGHSSLIPKVEKKLKHWNK